MDVENPIIMIVDFANVMFSGWYTKHELNSSGTNVNAVISFIRRLRLLKDTYNPKYLVIAEDISRLKTFRKKMYPAYKGKRKPMDPDIGKQMDITKSIISALGFPRISNELYEADDIIGMVSKWGSDHGYDTIVISSDKDMYQLVSPSTFIVCPRTDTFVDMDYMMQTYELTPDQWIELKMLQGDQSDNIPGIPGVGHKSALKLMCQYGSIRNIYNHISELSGGLQNKLKQGESSLPLTRELVTIIRDYNLINLTEPMLYRYEPDIQLIQETLDKFSIYSLDNVIYYGLCPQNTDNMEVHHYDAIENN